MIKMVTCISRKKNLARLPAGVTRDIISGLTYISEVWV